MFSSEGGIQRYNRRIIDALASIQARRDILKGVVIALWDSKSGYSSIPPNIEFIGCDSNKIKAICQFIKVMVVDKPGVIIYGHILLFPLLAIARIINKRAKQIICVYGIDVWSKPKPLRSFIVNKFANNIFSMSQYTADIMSNLYNIPSGKFCILPGASDLVDIDPIPKLNLRGKHKLLSVTRLSKADRYKNIDKVILAMPEILLRLPDTHYYIVGDGDWRNELEKLARDNHIEKYVHFIGELNEEKRSLLYSYYGNSDIFVLPSDSEGFGIVFLEAWNFHLPVIASIHGAAPEIVRDNIEGVCLEPSPLNISTAVIHLLEDDQFRKQLGDAGYKRLAHNYSGTRFFKLLQNYLTQ